MITALLILLTLAWCGLAFSLFAGADHLAARLRGGEPAFDWFDRTRWSGRSTRPKRATVAVLTYLAGAAIVLAALILILGLLDLAVDDLLDDPPRPSRERPL